VQQNLVGNVPADLADATYFVGSVSLPTGATGRIVAISAVAMTLDALVTTWGLLPFKVLASASRRATITDANSNIPLTTAGAAQAITAGQTLGQLDAIGLAPDERKGNALHGQITNEAGAGLDVLTGAAAVDDFYINALLQRLDTKETAIITEYVGATAVATHADWTIGTVDAPTGTSYRVIHDNLIVRPNDHFKVTVSGVDGTTEPSDINVRVDYIELSGRHANLY
jgi:hypothetical protein